MKGFLLICVIHFDFCKQIIVNYNRLVNQRYDYVFRLKVAHTS
jgi:hypothetical protein